MKRMPNEQEMRRRARFRRRMYLLAAVVRLFQKGATPGNIADELAELDEKTISFKGIRCPLCHWQPKSSSRWYCDDCGWPEYFFDSCGAVWNTFETRGRCPGCAHQWRWTSCLRCAGWSLHEDWYVTESS